MQKNEEFIGNVSAIGSNMEGIVRIGDRICFVPYAILGEKIKFKVLKVTKNLAFCKLLEVLAPAEERVRPKCSVYEKCGGCQLQHLRYKEQLKLKSNLVADCIKKIAGIDVVVPLTVRSTYEYEYRNKLQLPVRFDKANDIGFFAQNSHRIVKIDECPIQKPWCSKIITALKNYLDKSGVSCYNENLKEGIVRHVVVRETENKLSIVIVINGDNLPKYELLIEELLGYFSNFNLFININKLHNNVILGTEYKRLFGEEFISTSELGINYKVVPASFIQVNDGVKRKLYADVVKSLGADNNVSVIDAYSGAGLMTALISKTAKKVYGIEIVKEAVESANRLIKENNVKNVVNYCGPCEEVLPTLINTLKKQGETTAVVLDPPRKGCDKKVLDAILSSKPKKIIYVSCSPQTLARDLGILCGTLVYEGNELKKATVQNKVYEITKIQPYDMFPQTKHVETLVCLSKNN